jgi:nitroreductase
VSAAAVREAIGRHRSIRRYRPDPVDDELLDELLAAGVRASSSGNMQAYSVVVTRDPEQKRRLLEPHMGQRMVVEAPVLLTFCADFRRMRRWLALREAPDNFDNFMSFMIAAIDAVLVSQNVALAAEAAGLGVCFMGSTLASCDRIGEVLELPPGVVPVVGFSLGHPDESPPLRDRLPLEGLVHRERYRDPGPGELADLYRDREETGWARYMADPELRRRTEAAGARNLAQVYTKVKYTRDSHLGYSDTVLAYLAAQGFLAEREAGIASRRRRT